MIPTAADVVIAGGGMAGASAAAALAGLGYSVLLAEPGVDGAKRLAGELIHPPGAADLSQLGLLSCLAAAGAVPIRGFAVWPDVGPRAHLTEHRDGARVREVCVLPYADAAGVADDGLAVERRAMTDALLAAVAGRPGVSVWLGARVVSVDVAASDSAGVVLSREGREVRVRARLLVAADGATSHVRAMAGIGSSKTRLSSLVGFAVDGALPYPGFANVFVGPVTVLAYQVRADSVRVMFDLRNDRRGADVSHVEPGHLVILPEPFRGAVRRAIEEQPPLASASYTVVPGAVTRGRLALVGDAAGACHPLTATGLSVCARDALRLRQALVERDGDIPAALRRYADLREGPQRTRLALAGALYEAFSSSAPEMRFLRRGLLRYWARSPRGRAVSMALLSTRESRMAVMAAEYARVAGYGLRELLRRRTGAREPLRARAQAVYGLSRSTVRYAAAAARLRSAL